MKRFSEGEKITIRNVADRTMMYLDRAESRKYPPRSKQHDAIREAVDGLSIALFRADTTKMRSALSYCIDLIGEPLLSFWAETYGDAEHLCGHASVHTLQKTLTMKTKTYPPILDVCCGTKMFYFDKHDPRVWFQDIRRTINITANWERIEILPDQVADFTDMPYPDGTFRMVVFDPPHELRNTGMSKFADLFGSLNPKADVVGMPDYIQWRYSDWKGVIAAGFRECFRVLQDGGILIFKWSDVDVPLREVLELTDRKPVFGHHSGKRSQTHWLCFMK